MLTIQPPFGYRELTPLNRNHYVRLRAPGEMPHFAHDSQVVPLSYGELTVAAWHYPIIFVPDASGGYTMAALLGLGRNAYSNETADHKPGWDSQAYVPAYLRRYPFCMASLTIAGTQQSDLLVCAESDYVSDEPRDGAVRMFDDAGEPLQQWKDIEAFLKEYESDLAGSRAFTARLAELDLMEPFTANIVRPDGKQQTIAGMVRIDEGRLAALDAETVAELHRSGFLARIYIHLFSLQRFHELLARDAQRNAVIAPDAAPSAQESATSRPD
jgi:hypothetical protein